MADLKPQKPLALLQAGDAGGQFFDALVGKRDLHIDIVAGHLNADHRAFAEAVVIHLVAGFKPGPVGGDGSCLMAVPAGAEPARLAGGGNGASGRALLAAGELISHPAFRDFDIIPVSPEETYAANCIRINNRIMMPAGYRRTRNALAHRGYELIEIEMSEFQKMDGGLSCLSLRF